jgi:outer membrane biosynthesis protein TonB
MTADRTGRWLFAFIAVSVAAHAAAFGGLGRRSSPAGRRPPSLVTMEVIEPRARPAPEAPPRAPAPRPVRRAMAVAASPVPVAPPQPAPAPPPVADFTGVTLTNDGAGWVSAVGDGRASAGPLGPARPQAPAADELSVVGAPELRRPPEAPPLDDALARNYPQDERRQGITGTAVIRARIFPDGQARPLQVLSASRPAFAEACRRTIAGSRWSGPLDRQARPCATDISYTCRFELAQ